MAEGSKRTKRVRTKGHYRQVEWDSKGRFVSVKKWSSNPTEEEPDRRTIRELFREVYNCFLNAEAPLTYYQVAKACGLTFRTAKNIVLILSDLNVVEFIQPKKRQYWRLRECQNGGTI